MFHTIIDALQIAAKFAVISAVVAGSAVDNATAAAPQSTSPATPKARTAHYRADSGPAQMPRVLLSKGEEPLCKVKVGEAMPEIELPKTPGGAIPTSLTSLFGKKVTLVVFWKSDRRMAREQLADLGPDVMEPFGNNGVAVVGIAVNESETGAAAALKKAGASFPNLLDAKGKAFALVGSSKLPRTYLLDPGGKILWFDIEYSLATRRELRQALRAVAGEPATGQRAAGATGAKQE